MKIIILGNKRYGLLLKRRVAAAASLFLSSPSKYNKIIPTGGCTNKKYFHSEAYYMKQLLVKKYKIQREKIELEGRAMTTIQNAKYTKKMVGKGRIVVVTTKEHCERAKKIFNNIYGKNIKFVCV